MVPGLGQWQLYKDQRTRLLARCPRLIKSNTPCLIRTCYISIIHTVYASSVIYTKSDNACISFRVHHKSPMAAWQVWRFCSSSVSLWKHAVTPFFSPVTWTSVYLAMRGTDRESNIGRQHNSDRWCQLNSESTAGRATKYHFIQIIPVLRPASPMHAQSRQHLVLVHAKLKTENIMQIMR